jgi:hypothetical protein
MASDFRRSRAKGWNDRARPPVSHAEILSLIGRDLRAVYARLVEEEVPEHLAPHVEKLVRRERSAH